MATDAAETMPTLTATNDWNLTPDLPPLGANLKGSTKAFINWMCAPSGSHGTNPFNRGTPQELIQALGDAPVKVFALKAGEKAEF